VTESEIATVCVQGNQLLLDRGSREVVTDRDSRVSIAHAVAVGLLRGRALPEDFTRAAVADPDLRALRLKVRAELAAGMPTGAAAVTLTTHAGRSETVLIRHARGSLEQPLSDQELETKFRTSAPSFAAGGDEQIRRLWSLESAADLATLLQLLRAA
jgi:2-methylcitrate dehydratase PrpD